MRLALIPPRGLEYEALRSSMHLALAQNDWEAYNGAYKEAGSQGHFIIVDNGAAEGKMVSDHELVWAAQRLGAKEIVVPDVVRCCEETLERMSLFFARASRMVSLGDYRFMGVVQGISMNEIKRCVEFFANNPNVRTIGIPRHLIKTFRSPGARLQIVQHIKEHFSARFQIHFLGTDRTYLRELYHVGKYMGTWVRSVDTSTPFIYALQGAMLPKDPKQSIKSLERDKNYFTEKHTANAFHLGHNVEVLNAWCRGEHGS
jgi:hypothetical protein